VTPRDAASLQTRKRGCRARFHSQPGCHMPRHQRGFVGRSPLSSKENKTFEGASILSMHHVAKIRNIERLLSSSRAEVRRIQQTTTNRGHTETRFRLHSASTTIRRQYAHRCQVPITRYQWLQPGIAGPACHEACRRLPEREPRGAPGVNSRTCRN